MIYIKFDHFPKITEYIRITSKRRKTKRATTKIKSFPNGFQEKLKFQSNPPKPSKSIKFLPTVGYFKNGF
jgi:hypothetical protein